MAISCVDALQTLQALHVEEAVGLGSAGCYSALVAPHGSDATPYLVEGFGVLREAGPPAMIYLLGPLGNKQG